MIRYLDGKLSIHEGKEYQVMTNSPRYELQLTVNDYWKEVGGLRCCRERTVRRPFYCVPLSTFRHSADCRCKDKLSPVCWECDAQCLRSVWYQYTGEASYFFYSAGVSVSDQKNKVYYFESNLTRTCFGWILRRLILVRRLGWRKLSWPKEKFYRRCVKDLRIVNHLPSLFRNPVM